MKNKILSLFVVGFFVITLSLLSYWQLVTAQTGFEWTPPTQNFPKGNTQPPLDKSSTPQIKDGDLTARSFSATYFESFNIPHKGTIKSGNNMILLNDGANGFALNNIIGGVQNFISNGADTLFMGGNNFSVIFSGNVKLKTSSTLFEIFPSGEMKFTGNIANFSQAAKGLILPNKTREQIGTAVASGTLTYENEKVYVFTGLSTRTPGGWVEIGGSTGGGPGQQPWSVVANGITYNVAGKKVGIGTSTPTSILQVVGDTPVDFSNVKGLIIPNKPTAQFTNPAAGTLTYDNGQLYLFTGVRDPNQSFNNLLQKQFGLTIEEAKAQANQGWIAVGAGGSGGPGGSSLWNTCSGGICHDGNVIIKGKGNHIVAGASKLTLQNTESSGREWYMHSQNNGALQIYRKSGTAYPTMLEFPGDSKPNVSAYFLNGNVGIGKEDPTSLLHVYGSGTKDATISLDAQNGKQSIQSWGVIAINPDSDNSGDKNILLNGNVGVSTPDPQQVLDVSGNVLIRGIQNNPSYSLIIGGGLSDADRAGSPERCTTSGAPCKTDTTPAHDNDNFYSCAQNDTGDYIDNAKEFLGIPPVPTGYYQYRSVHCVIESSGDTYKLRNDYGTLKFLNNSSNERFTIGQDGAVKIGGLVTIGTFGSGSNGLVLKSNTGLTPFATWDNGNTKFSIRSDTDTMVFGKGDSSGFDGYLYIKQDGVVGSNGAILAGQGVPGANAGFSFGGNEGGRDTGMFSPGDGVLQLYVNGVKKAEFTGSSTWIDGLNSKPTIGEVSVYKFNCDSTTCEWNGYLGKDVNNNDAITNTHTKSWDLCMLSRIYKDGDNPGIRWNCDVQPEGVGTGKWKVGASKWQVAAGRIMCDFTCFNYGNFSPPPPPPQNLKRIFITGDPHYQGNLGGINGANAKCQNQADQAGLGGTWKAWISDSTHDAKDNTTHNGYKRVGDNVVVASDWNQFIGGNLSASINRNASGVLITDEPNYIYTWTGTKTDGTKSFIGNIVANRLFCLDWTSSINASEYEGKVGSYNFQNRNWTEYHAGNNSNQAGASCNSPLRLYCLEQ